MAAGEFKIRERSDLGGITPPGGDAIFIWTSTRRSSPVGVITPGLTQKNARTDYAGGTRSTIQALGPKHSDITFEGSWRDKYNPLIAQQVDQPLEDWADDARGFAVQTMRAFKALIRRGNPVEISFQDMAFIGLISDSSFPYRHEGEIGYRFTLMVTEEKGETELASVPLEQRGKDPATLASELEQQVFEDLIQTHALAPDAALAGTAVDDVSSSVDSLQTNIKELSSAISQRVLNTGTDFKAGIARAVGASDAIISSADDIVNTTRSYRAPTALLYQSAQNVMAFEVWSRGLRSVSHKAIFDTWEARRQLDRKSDPDAIALYRPYKNESVYSISQRFYGVPYQWGIIMERNRLTSTILSGTELLIIPEAQPK